MMRVPVTARLLAPVVIKRDRQSERSESVQSVAGTLVRGALAAIYLQHHGQVDGVFERLFLNEATCRFGPLDPGPYGFPLTAVSCKREGLRHALADVLWFRVAQHHVAGNVPEDTDTGWRQCARCQADLKAQEGFWRPDDGGPRELKTDHQVAAHVGIDRRTSTAAESMFYTLEALVPSGKEVDLYGWIRADDDALDALQRLLKSERYRISVGHARTRGYGDVRLQLGTRDAMDQETQSRLDRWNRWSRDLIDLLAAPPLSVFDLTPDDFYFALSFPTGAVIVDRFLRHSIDPADMIDWLPPMSPVAAAFPLAARPALRLESGGAIRWIAAVTRHERLRGWNAAHGLPRQDDWAVARGAVYVYRFEGAAHERAPLLRKLAVLADDGVGLRRNEGFGVAVVSDEFHRTFRNQEAPACMC